MTTFSGDETFYVVEDDDGTPVSRKVTVEDLATGLAAQTGFTSKFPKLVAAVGDGGGDHTTTSGTFADIHASLYDMSIPAVAGDVLVFRLSTQWYHSNSDQQCRIKFTVAGSVSTGMPTNGLYVSAPGTGSNFDVFAWRHVVQSGEISGGNVAVVPQFATTSGTLSIRNDGTNGKPLMTVENWRQ